MPVNDDQLMRYLDGELSSVEGREVERELAASAELRTKRDGLLEMRDLLRARYEVAEDDAAPQLAVMWERLRSGLPAPAAAPVPAGLWSRIRDWLDTYRSHLVTGAFAAAAGAIFATIVTSRAVSPGVATIADDEREAEVESLEVLGGSGMVFQAAPEKKGDDGATIIWVTANEPDNDGDGTPDPPQEAHPEGSPI